MKSKGLSAQTLTTLTTTDNSVSPSIKWYRNSNFCLVFKESCLKQKSRTYILPYRTSFFFAVLELDTWSRNLNSDFTLKECLFGGIRLAKNADPDKYVYTGYGIGFDSHLGGIFKTVIIFEVDNSSSMHIDKKGKK